MARGPRTTHAKEMERGLCPSCEQVNSYAIWLGLDAYFALNPLNARAEIVNANVERHQRPSNRRIAAARLFTPSFFTIDAM
jgi:hypothetical protein